MLPFPKILQNALENKKMLTEKGQNRKNYLNKMDFFIFFSTAKIGT